MKRTPEEAEKAVKEAQADIKAGKYNTVAEALEDHRISAGTWQKYRKKRNPYTKKSPEVTEITPPTIHEGGSKTVIIVTSDPEMIRNIIKENL